MKPQEIAIYGAGGFAREVAWLIESCSQAEELYKIVCFIDDTPEHQGKIVNGIPVMSLEEAHERFSSAHVVAAVGNPKSREAMVRKAEEKGFAFETIVHPKTEMSKWIEMGLGTVICAGNILTTNIRLGNHVQINLDCTIGHDVILGDFTTLAPGVHVSGWVHIGKYVYIGTGVVITNGTSNDPVIIEDGVIIGAGACVTKSLSANRTYVGVPATPIKA